MEASHSKPSLKHPVLLLEFNEIPWRVIDFFSAREGFDHLRTFFAESKQLTSMTVDEGELSPWRTWPTLHRGLANTEHQVMNLGQDPATFKGEAIWDTFLKQGESIGVCGSLQSWPPRNPGQGFFIPDTFAHDEQCYPKHVSLFQKINLALVRENGRQVTRSLPSAKDLVQLAINLPRLGIRLRTLVEIAMQLIAERFDTKKISRRPVFQAILMWDIFKRLYDAKSPPAFSTFFTNHVAGLIHRYWKDLFPNDFGLETTHGPHFETIEFGMKVVDRILKDVLEIQKANPSLRVIWASSMGQAAITNDQHEGFEANLPSLQKLFDAIGVTKDQWSSKMAMAPQVACDILNDTLRQQVKICLELVTTASGNRVFSVDEQGPSLSVTLITPRKADKDHGSVTVKALSGKKQNYTWSELDIRLLEVDPGTAYHIPEGSLAILDPVRRSTSRTLIDADKIKGLILEEAYGYSL